MQTEAVVQWCRSKGISKWSIWTWIWTLANPRPHGRCVAHTLTRTAKQNDVLHDSTSISLHCVQICANTSTERTHTLIIRLIYEPSSLLLHQKKSNGTGAAVSDERVDYVVVDQQRTLALKSTREAWTDGRQSTETDTPTKGPK